MPILPEPSGHRIAIHLHPRAERAVRSGHPWVFAEGIRRQRREGSPGDLAVLFDASDRFLAVGLYDPASPIRVRVLQHGDPAVVDAGFLSARVAAAAERRASLPGEGTTGYRVVHGENDALPGLVVDRYDASLVVKLYSAAWVPHLAALLPALESRLAPERVVLRLSRNVQRRGEALHGLEDGAVLAGTAPEGPVPFCENHLRFEADLLRGQKTGFFLDQRENRARVERLAAGRRVLNVFGYTGGFSLYAARGGASAVTTLDLSPHALEGARRTFARNAALPAVAAARHDLLQGDAFALLARLGAEGERFGMVILDPPAFARSGREVEGALESYRRLARLGAGTLAPGGVLVAASCSGRVDAPAFFAAVREGAREGGRRLEGVETTGHPLDHPVGFREGAYLKSLFATVP